MFNLETENDIESLIDSSIGRGRKASFFYHGNKNTKETSSGTDAPVSEQIKKTKSAIEALQNRVEADQTKPYTIPASKPLPEQENLASTTSKPREILAVTNDMSLVYALRLFATRIGLGVQWTNNFWMATSYIHTSSFAALVLDDRLDSVEERYVLDFMSEYDKTSQGKKVLYSHEATPKHLKRLISERGDKCIEANAPIEDLLEALDIPQK